MAKLIRVIDGDSLEVEAHIWLGQRLRIQVRLEGVDAPELKGNCDDERDLAREARAELQDLLESGRGEEPSLLLYDIRNGKYAARVLARVHLARTSGEGAEPVPERGQDLGELLLSRGLARPYEGGRRVSWCKKRSAPHHGPQEVHLKPRRKPLFANQP